MKANSSRSTKIIELLVAYHQGPSIKLRNQLVHLNTGLVRKVVHRLNHQCSEAYEDLEQIGFLGLIRAIERFDPKQGCAFSSFAVPYIRGEVLHYLRDRSGTVKIPRRFQDLQRSAQKVRNALTQQLGRSPSDAEIATELEISEAEWQEVKLAHKNRSLISLDAMIGGQSDDTTLTVGESLPDARASKLMQWEEDRAQLQGALSHLEENIRVVIEQVYLNGVARKQVAEDMDISPMTVTRRLQRGVKQLSDIMEQPVMAPEVS
ncbi:MAG: sigma-70 family RNA polymerase sigma factor [Cyanobacteria bacterium P01_F01_bin.86]